MQCSDVSFSLYSVVLFRLCIYQARTSVLSLFCRLVRKLFWWPDWWINSLTVNDWWTHRLNYGLTDCQTYSRLHMYWLNRMLLVNLFLFRCLMLMHSLRKAWLVLRWKQLQRWDLVKKVHYSLPLKSIKIGICDICHCWTFSAQKNTRLVSFPCCETIRSK